MQYEPETVPEGEEALARYLQRELNRIAEVFTAVENIQLAELNVEPEKPREGLIVLADGTNWNPGSGAGFYGYRGGAWQFLG